MRKSRVLSLLLAVVFIMTTVTIPAFADVTYVNGDPTHVIVQPHVVAPIRDLPLHVSHNISDAGASYAWSAASLPAGFALSEDGILTISSDACTAIENTAPYTTVNGNVTITDSSSESVQGPAIARAYRGFDVDFDNYVATDYHTVRPFVSNVTVTSDGKNWYGEKTSGKSYIGLGGESLLMARTAGSRSPFVLEMDFKDMVGGDSKRSGLYLGASAVPYCNFFKLASNTSGKLDTSWLNGAGTVNPAFDANAFDANDGNWHNFKWVITPADYVLDGTTRVESHFDLYIDNQLVVSNVRIDLPGASEVLLGTSSGQLDRGTAADPGTGASFRMYAGAIDNVKRYGTSLGFAHDVVLNKGTEKVGAVLTTSAQITHMPGNELPEALEYAFFSEDAVTGEYTLLGEGSSYTVKSADEGKIIRSAARVKDFDGCTTDWVMSKDKAVIGVDIRYIDGDPANYIEQGNIMAPLPGMPLRISHKVNVPATYSLSDTTKAGITLTEDGILNITNAASEFNKSNVYRTANVSVTAETPYGNVTGSRIGTIFGSFEYTFEDGRLPSDEAPTSNRAPMNGIEITSDASKGYYAHKSGGYIGMNLQYMFHSRAGIYMAPFIFEADLKGFTAFNQYQKDYFYSALWATDGDGFIKQGWIDYAVNSGATFNPDFDYENFNARYNWHNYKWVITPNAKVVDGKVVYAHFDLYVDNVLLAKNVSIYFPGFGTNGSLQNGISTDKSIFISATDVDNFRRYGTSLGFAHDVEFAGEAVIGSTLTASAELAHAPYYNIPETLEKAFFVSDTVDGEYELIATGDSYVVGAEAAGKYIKAAARVKEDIAGGVATEWVLSNDTTFVPDSAISSIALKVDGADADINAVNLAGKTEAQIDITITAASPNEAAAKFVLAQYDVIGGKKVLVGAALNDADLTADAASFDLSLKASNINADTTFRLFIFAKEGLVPVKDIVLK